MMLESDPDPHPTPPYPKRPSTNPNTLCILRTLNPKPGTLNPLNHKLNEFLNGLEGSSSKDHNGILIPQPETLIYESFGVSAFMKPYGLRVHVPK